jgi:hypothetical protein
MTVEVLRLAGPAGQDADAKASALVADVRAHPDLTRLLVIDDTAALISHSAVYERLLTSHRLDHLICVAVGPRAGDGREFRFPGNIGGGRGSAVLWVGDPHGIDWRLAASAIAVGHSGNSASGLHHLVELLSVDEVFDRVCEIARNVPGGVASPGLRLTGADDEAASFAAALVMAIRRLIGPGSGLAPADNGPFSALQVTRPGTARLAEGGRLSQDREDVITGAASASGELALLAGFSGLVGLEQPSVRDHVIETGTALGAFRDAVARLLQVAHAPGGLTDKQRAELKAAGVRLPETPPAAANGGVAGADSARSTVYEATAGAIRGGDTLPQVTRRLNQTASALEQGGSASYLPEVTRVCPPALVSRLTGPPSPPRPRRWWLPAAVVLAVVLGALAGLWSAAAGVVVGVLALAIGVAAAAWSWRAQVGEYRRRLALDDAVRSANALSDLVATVAAREWSGNVTLDEVDRARIALDGVISKLAEYAADAADAGSGAQASRAARLSESLTPGLRDLVLAVLKDASDTASVIGQAAFEQARGKTAELVTSWTGHARQHGVLAPPPFATYAANDIPYAREGEMAEIADAVQQDPREVMWQLCTPTDLSALDVGGAPQVVVFAPRLTRPPLADMLPQDTVWTSSGALAGLIRLVPLRAGIASASWTTDEQPAEPGP